MAKQFPTFWDYLPICILKKPGEIPRKSTARQSFHIQIPRTSIQNVLHKRFTPTKSSKNAITVWYETSFELTHLTKQKMFTITV